MNFTTASTVRVPGTCGELVQGWLDGSHFLVTCPVAFYSQVSVVLSPGSGKVRGPLDCPKSLQAAALTLSYLGCQDLDAHLTIHSPIPRGKGMASSTADVAGAIAAVGLALGKTLSPPQIARLSLAVEPSDGVMFPGIALFDHRDGTAYEELGPPPPIEVVVLDFGGTVDTVGFNQVDRRAILSPMEAQFQEALGLVREGVKKGDPARVGVGATLSALANQHILFKPYLAAVIAFSQSVGGVGVCVAHSGTAVGILMDSRSGQGQAVAEEARRGLPGLEVSFSLPLIGGGIIRQGEIDRVGDGYLQ